MLVELFYLGGIGVVSSFVPPHSIDEPGLRRQHRLPLMTSKRKSPVNDHGDDVPVMDREEEGPDDDVCYNRRGFFRRVAGSTVASWMATGSSLSPVLGVPSAQARGLVSFPCTAPLLNVYHLMRAGESLLEEIDIWSTNPLFLTNREAALSEKGVQQAQAASRILEAADINPSVIKYSLAASAVDTAMVIRDELKVGQNRLVPEFTFMDPRAIGKWDMMSMAETFPAVVALDELEAGKDGRGARPPPNTDGTPQDTLADQAIRLRQVMSILETQFSGDNIVLVFPDGSSPALLSAMIAGIPYNKAHVLEFAPGEIRLDVTMAPTLKLYETKLKENAQQYKALVEEGKAELNRLRSMNDEDLISKKDVLIEQERVEIEEEYRRKENARMAKEESERQQRQNRLQEMERTRLRSRGIQVDDSTPVEEPSLPPLVIGGAFAAYAVVALSQAGQDTGRDPRRSNSTNAVLTTPGGSGLSGGAILNTTSTRSGPTPMAEGSLFADMLDEYQVPTSSIYGDTPLYDTPKKSVDDRKGDARKAMQDYMDQDDGSDAWLQAMASIIDEDDGDSIFESDIEETNTFGKVNGSSEKL